MKVILPTVKIPPAAKKPLRLAIFLGVALIIGVQPFLFADPPTALVVRLLGQARIQSGESAWRPVTRGMAVQNGDRIQTRENSSLIIAARGEAVQIRLGPNSDFTLTSLNAGTGATRGDLTSGSSWYSVDRARLTGEFEIRTPTTVASVRGTKFSVIESDAGTLGCVCAGAVQTQPLSNPEGSAVAEAGASHTISRDGSLVEKDFTQYFRGLKVDRSFATEIQRDGRLNYCTQCHRMTNIETDTTPDPTEY